MANCHDLNPCFPRRVLRTLSQRDRCLYVIFHVLLWSGTVAFFSCLGAYVAQRNYLYFILPLPCTLLTLSGLFGFRWLAIRNNDKFEPPCEPCPTPPSEPGCPEGEAEAAVAAPPPPLYSDEYNGPVFTVFGTLKPPPSYDEATETVSAPARGCQLRRLGGDAWEAPEYTGCAP